METQLHGALVEVLGVGILLLGPSGIGKSESALELVQRGHRLVADDVVRLDPVTEASGTWLRGSAPELIRHYMEIRGLGLLYIPDLYGEQAVREEARIDLVCRLETWRSEADYERVGLERPSHALAGVELPLIVLPLRPSTSMATLIEAAARDHRQRMGGHNAARDLDRRLRADGGTS